MSLEGKQYIAYLRVSTQKQGQSGLGMEAQQHAVRNFLKPGDGIVTEYVEVESGKKDNRVQLHAAIGHAKRVRGTLLIAKLDRLSRNAGFIFALRDSGVDFVCVDMPDANTLTIGIFAVLAQHERELISSRTKAALQAKKAQGAQLGKPENLTPLARKKGELARREKAAVNENNRRAAAMIESHREKGMGWAAIARRLNESGHRASQGGGFQATQVQRIYRRLAVGTSVNGSL
ncbi:recombinase family protein [Pontibacter qinzhouensis]|uniref:Recombinase family protein n=1 Tax=Pontibacter qinzhouensis TaxID=2603253 RepID=A0A5C8IU81_9BACT|nr:recombinase family protein [Pontibacter qinzhouensis]TXK24827.1 recombinase family protein [Pontibacter qinzhouensis]